MIYNFLTHSSLSAEDAVISFLITIIVFIFSLSIHEFAHAFAAKKMGDLTAKMAGRMTINPFKHLDLTGFLFFLFLGVGWAKPVPINPNNFKNFKKGTRVVSISGVLANLIVSILSAIILIVILQVGVINSIIYYCILFLEALIVVNGLLFMFNILPIPSFDGFNFLTTILKPDNKFLQFLYKKGFKLLMGFILISILTDLFFGFDIFSIYINSLSSLEFYLIGLLGG